MTEYTKQNVLQYRKIFIVSYDASIEIKDCITIDEKIFPFHMSHISAFLGKNERNGWYLQQLLKLYAGIVIPDILNNYLVIDADTFFLKPTAFFTAGGKSAPLPLYNYGTEYHLPYFGHMARLHPSLTKQLNVSGICHHMLFQTNRIKELFALVENYHATTPDPDPFWVIFLKMVSPNDAIRAGASEYELYFNYLLIYCKNTFEIRPLQWKNANLFNGENKIIDFKSQFDYISSHYYLH